MKYRARATICSGLMFVAACTPGGDTTSSNLNGSGNPVGPSEVITPSGAQALLMQATFGPTQADIDELAQMGPSAWLQAEFAKPQTLYIDKVFAKFPNGVFRDADEKWLPGAREAASNAFWEKAVAGDDQLRQRMAFALSQILVVSYGDDSDLSNHPETMAAYMDIIQQSAFGNYRDLMENVTYSVAMAEFLTYMRNRKGDAKKGRVPDENYARELMQLFTIGLVELNQDGTPKSDASGNLIETYTNEDVTGLAKVFTGLSHDTDEFWKSSSERPPQVYYTPLKIFDEQHSQLEKTFLGVTIPADTTGADTITTALDTLYKHPNLAPFVSRQLIQRFTASHPSPAYVARVASAFESGTFTLGNGGVVGAGRRGDLQATLAAVLMDPDARDTSTLNNPEFGKIREPVIRFTHWARAFNVNGTDASDERDLRDTRSPSALSQHPYKSPSVFNFYRPGYVAPGTETGDAGLNAPELQIVNASTVVGYANFMTDFITDDASKISKTDGQFFRPDYTAELALADTTTVLVDQLNALLLGDRMSSETRAQILAVIDQIPVSAEDPDPGRLARVEAAVVMIITSVDYLVQF